MISQPLGGAFTLSEKTDFRAFYFIMPFFAAKDNDFCENHPKFGCICL
jgi:hypothetical protein